MPRKPEPIEHGTPAGYLKHQRRKIPHSECSGVCLSAWRVYNQDLRRKKGK